MATCHGDSRCAQSADQRYRDWHHCLQLQNATKKNRGLKCRVPGGMQEKVMVLQKTLMVN